MKKLALVVVLLALSACTGTRGTIGSQRVCTNDYLLGVISLSELVSPLRQINSPAFNKNVLPLKKDIFVLPKKTPPILSKYKTLLICYFLQYHLIVD